MSNPILQQLEQQNGKQNPLAQILNNPNYPMVMDMIKGKDPKEVFYQECSKRGVDPNSILNQLK